MEENLNNQQVRPGDETQMMHVVFSSDDEMLSFYLTYCRLLNPSANLLQTTDKKMLEDLEKNLYKNVTAFGAVSNSQFIGAKDIVRGLGKQMMNTDIASAVRLKYWEAVSLMMDFVLNVAKNSGCFKTMSRMNALHLENVKYLLKQLKEKAGGEKESEAAM